MEAAADEALSAVRADGITPAEFERARHQLRARLVFESDSVTNIAHQIGYFHTLGDVDLYHGLEGRLAACHPRRRRACGAHVSVARPPHGRLVPAGGCAGRERPLMATAVHRGLAPLRKALANGATVIAQHTTTHRAVTIHASVAAGSGHDADSALGTAYFVAKVIDRGTESHSADALAEAFDGRGVSLSVSVSRHLMTFTCTCLAEDVEAVLGLVAGVIIDPDVSARPGGAASIVGHHLAPAGRGQPGGGRDRSADGRALPGRPSVRPAREGHRGLRSRQSGASR